MENWSPQLRNSIWWWFSFTETCCVFQMLSLHDYKQWHSLCLCALREEWFYFITQKCEQELVSFMKTYTWMSWEQMGFGEWKTKELKDKVSEGANAELSGTLSLEELHKAFQGMDSAKGWGIYGFPFEFYYIFWTEVGKDLLQVLNDSLGSGKLPVSSLRVWLSHSSPKMDIF